MDAQLKAKWVDALRSGEYRQAHGKLIGVDGGSYCCLGVACKIGASSPFPLAYDERLAADTVAGHLNISIVQQDRLVRMNDFEKRNFSEIAEYIEANL